MTERIYYTEPTKTTFEALVVAVESSGSQSIVELDKTAFYPSSGGQPNDTGVLGGARVVDVRELDAGRIGHVITGVVEESQVVTGMVDWPRRFDHMQQHSGQHVLSAVFDQRHSARTVGFHLGQEVSTIDLDRHLPVEAVAEAELDANEAVWRNHPVSIRFATGSEVAALPLRKEPVRSGDLRLIEIDSVDLSACGGTHVDRTGTIGLIAIRGTERFRNGLRVSFLCGGRVLKEFRARGVTLAASAQLFSGNESDIPDQISTLQHTIKGLQRAHRTSEERLSVYEAAALAANAEEMSAWSSIVSAVEVSEAGALRMLVNALIAEPHRVAVLFSSALPAMVVVARSADVDLDARTILSQLTERFGGSGGGKSNLAQGGGLTGVSSELLDAARAILSEHR